MHLSFTSTRVPFGPILGHPSMIGVVLLTAYFFSSAYCLSRFFIGFTLITFSQNEEYSTEFHITQLDALNVISFVLIYLRRLTWYHQKFCLVWNQVKGSLMTCVMPITISQKIILVSKKSILFGSVTIRLPFKLLKCHALITSGILQIIWIKLVLTGTFEETKNSVRLNSFLHSTLCDGTSFYWR